MNKHKEKEINSERRMKLTVRKNECLKWRRKKNVWSDEEVRKNFGVNKKKERRMFGGKKKRERMWECLNWRRRRRNECLKWRRHHLKRKWFVRLHAQEVRVVRTTTATPRERTPINSVSCIVLVVARKIVSLSKRVRFLSFKIVFAATVSWRSTGVQTSARRHHSPIV